MATFIERVGISWMFLAVVISQREGVFQFFLGMVVWIMGFAAYAIFGNDTGE